MSSSSAREVAAERSRNSCSGFARTVARLPASIVQGLSRSIPRRAPRSRPRGVHVHQQQPPQAPPLAPPSPTPPFVPEELYFFSAFEQQYGSHHPFFYGCRFSEVLGIARREGKHVFVYLHEPDHPYTGPFCRSTLCSDVVVEFLDANFVSWAAVTGRGEGSGMAASLQPGTFPFCAVVAPVSSESITVLQRVEGPVTPSELVEILQRTIDEQSVAFRALTANEQSVAFRALTANEQAAAFRASRPEEEERRRSALRVRQEQDAAYLESLWKDQEKQRSTKGLHEGIVVKPKASPKYQCQEATETDKTTQIRAPTHKETAPSHRNEANTKIMIRFPNGQRSQQGFLHTDTIREIYKYVNSLGIPGIGQYQLVRSYPRKTYGHQQLAMTLRDAGFHPSVTLYIEKLQ